MFDGWILALTKPRSTSQLVADIGMAWERRPDDFKVLNTFISRHKEKRHSTYLYSRYVFGSEVSNVEWPIQSIGEGHACYAECPMEICTPERFKKVYVVRIRRFSCTHKGCSNHANTVSYPTDKIGS